MHDWFTLARDTISGALWSWYFVASRRVAATFVERLNPGVRVAADVALPSQAALSAEPTGSDDAVASMQQSCKPDDLGGLPT
jgi:hypothetical protein